MLDVSFHLQYFNQLSRKSKRQTFSQHKMLMKSSTITSAVAGLAIPFDNFAAQTPLSSTSISQGIRFNVTEQDDSICDAGNRQWTGWVHVSDQKSLFFCMLNFRNYYCVIADSFAGFFESRSNPTTDPVVLWMNGYERPALFGKD